MDIHGNDDVHEVHDDSSSSESEAEEKPQTKSALKKSTPAPAIVRPELPEQPEPKDLDLKTITPLTDFVIARQATINIGTIGIYTPFWSSSYE
jgi:translation initiation factor 2 subunit 3